MGGDYQVEVGGRCYLVTIPPEPDAPVHTHSICRLRKDGTPGMELQPWGLSAMAILRAAYAKAEGQQ